MNPNYSQMNQHPGNMSQASGNQFMNQNNISAPNAQMNTSTGMINPAMQGQVIMNVPPNMGAPPSSNVSQVSQPQLSQQEVQQATISNKQIMTNNASLTKLAQFMKKAGQSNFSSLLNLAIDHTIVICDMAQFINLMITRDIGLTRSQANELVANFIYTKKDVKEVILMNISSIQEAIAKCGAYNQKEQDELKKKEDQQYDSLKAKEIIFKTVLDYGMRKGLTPEQFFKGSVKNKTNLLSPEELALGLQGAGAKIQVADISPAFEVIKLEFVHFQKILAGFQYERIDDCSHWAFHIFEDMRRKLQGPGNSLCEKFGVQPDREVRTIPWSVFLTTMKKLEIHISQEEDKKLQELFAINTAGGVVSMDLLMRLKGLDCGYNDAMFHTFQKSHLGQNRPVVPSGSSSATQKVSNAKGVTKEAAPDQKNVDKAQQQAFLERKKAIKKLLMEIQKNNLSADELLSKYNIGSATSMTAKVFNELLGNQQFKIDLDVQRQIKQFYFSGQNEQISIQNLSKSLSSFLGMQRVISMIFGRAEMFCPLQGVKNIAELFKKMLNRPQILEFTLQQMKEFCQKLGLKVTDLEAEMLGFEYDPGLSAASINMQIFENDYNEWTKERASKISWKQQSFNFIDKQKQMYKSITPRQEKQSAGTSATVANQQMTPQVNQFQNQPQMQMQQQPMGGKQYQIDPRTNQPITTPNGMKMIKVINPQNGQQYFDQHGHSICQLENPATGQVEMNMQGQQVFYMFNTMSGMVEVNPQTGQMEISNFDPRTGGINQNMLPTHQQPSPMATNQPIVNQPGMPGQVDKATQEFIQQVKSWIKNKNAGGRLAIELAKKNSLGTGVFVAADYNEALKAVGAKVSSKQVGDILGALQPTTPGGNQYSAQAFFGLLSDQHEAYSFYQEVMKGPQINIQSASTSQQPNISTNVSALMGQIGFKVEAVKNYEQVFKNNCGSDKFNPVLTEQEMTYALKELSININPEERNELSNFFRQNKTEDGKVYLTQLFKAFGIESKTTGVEGMKKHLSKKFLTDDELIDCAKKLFAINKEYSKKRGAQPATIFDGKLTPKEKDGAYIKMDTFKKILETDLGVDFFKKYFGNRNSLNNIQLYLEEEESDLISIAKFKQAIVLKENARPLTQHSADDRNAYKKQISKELDQATQDGKTRIPNFLAFLKKNNIEMKQLMGTANIPVQYPVANFIDRLKMLQYQPLTTYEDLVQDIDPKANLKVQKPTFTVAALKKVMDRNKTSKSTPDLIKAKLLKQDARVKDFLDKIIVFMRKQGLNVKQLHAELDINKDGAVTKEEFVTRLSAHGVDSLGIKLNELGIVFDALDTSADGELSLQEFSLYLGVVKEDRKTRINNLDPVIASTLKEEVHNMFSHFDIDGNGKVDAREIYQTLLSLGQKRSIDQCEEMIRSAGADSEGIDRSQFEKLMYPIMIEDYISFEENVDDLRRLFLEADVDYSGKLSIDEVFTALRKQGIEITKQECVELMLEVDIDQNGSLDIDEFLSIFGAGNQLHFDNERNQNTFDKIQHHRKGKPMDFLKIFKNMPNNFVPSFIGEKWDKFRRNLPSSVFSAKVDPKTMLWKDVRQVRSEDIQGTNFQKPENKPYTRLIESTIGGQITLVKASGVPLPKVGDKSSFKDEHIVKRVIRVAVEKYVGNEMAGHWELIGNAIQVPAIWKATAEDVWEFDSTNKSLRNILMRTTKQDGLEESEVGDPARVILELVVYCQTGDATDDTSNIKNVKELCCGWCKVNVDQFKKKQTLKLEIQGGSPYQEMEIKKDDVRAERQGLAFMSKLVVGVEQKFEIDIVPLTSMDKDEKAHLELMPSTCFMHKALLYFISGFINYKSDKLLGETEGGVFKKPTGDHIISSFPMIYDNPDIVEEMATLWFEDIQPQINSQKYNTKFIMDKTCDYIARLYPILYSDEFKDINMIDSTKSAAGSKKLLERRQKLIRSSLRYKQTGAKQQETKPISEMSTYRPFNIRELNFSVWDTTGSKKDNFLRNHGNRGGIGFDEMPSYEEDQINSTSKKVSFAQ